MSKQLEVKIAKYLIEQAFVEGATHGVASFEGEDETELISDPETLLDQSKGTDISYLDFRDKDNARLGIFMLVWGNDEDIISDCTDNPWCDKLFTRVTARFGLV